MKGGYTIATLRRVMAWAKEHPDQTVHIPFADWTKQDFTGREWRAWFREKLEQKINRFEPASRGRKDDPDWWRQMRQCAYQLNTPRLRIHWLPVELRARFAERLRRGEDD